MHFMSIYLPDMCVVLSVMVGQQVDLLVNIDQSPFPILLIGRNETDWSKCLSRGIMYLARLRQKKHSSMPPHLRDITVGYTCPINAT